MATKPAVSAQVVGNAFVEQYYHILHHSPDIAYKFYQDRSNLGRPEEDGSMSSTTTMRAINDKILSLNYADLRAEIKSVDAQESFNGGVSVLVTGYLTGKDSEIRNFSQSFFLAPQERGYFVLNDIFQYVDTVNQHDRNHVPVVPSSPPPPSMEPAFSCPICMGPFVEAMSTKCGHIFCKVCINASIADQGKCPTCRKKIGMKDTIRVYLPTTH